MSGPGKHRPGGWRSPGAGEGSFTLIETIIALGLMVTVVLEVSNVQGRAIVFADSNRKTTQAIWLAKAVMAKVEWGKDFYDLKEFKLDLREQEFPEELCPKDPLFRCDFKYNIEIKNWPLPLVDLMAKSLLGAEKDKENSPLAGMLDMVKSQLKEMIGEEFLKIARIEVFWPEGSERSSTTLTYLLTNQLPVDGFIEQQAPIKDKDEPPVGKPGDTKSVPAVPGTTPGGGGAGTGTVGGGTGGDGGDVGGGGDEEP